MSGQQTFESPLACFGYSEFNTSEVYSMWG